MAETRLEITPEQAEMLRREGSGTWDAVISSVDGEGNVVFRLAEPVVRRDHPQEKAWLLFEVTRQEAHKILSNLDSVVVRTGWDDVITPASVTVHPADCCCKNCPWQGDHGSGRRHGDEES